jgi:hypothetical protein
LKRYLLKFYFSVNLNKILCFIHIKFLRVRSGVSLFLIFQILIFSFIKAFLRLWLFFVNVLELHHSMEERKMICTIKRVLIWRFTLVFMKSYAGNWQINSNSRNWRNQMTEQYRTIGPEIHGFLSDRQSFYRTCPSVWRYFVFTESVSMTTPPINNIS